MANYTHYLFTLSGWKRAWLKFFFRKEDKIPGLLDIEEGAALYKYSKSSFRALEIGSYLGRSTGFLLRSLGKTGILHCVDTWESQGVTGEPKDTFDRFNKNISKYKTRPILHPGLSNDIAKEWKLFWAGIINFLFIDGGHDYQTVRDDIDNWLPFVSKGGIIAFHDYGNPCGVKQAVDEIVSRGDIQFIEMVKSMYIAEKL